MPDDITYMWDLKYEKMDLHTKDKQTHRHKRTDLWLPRGRGCQGGMDKKFGISRCKLLYTEWINNKVLLYSTGSYVQYPVINNNGKDFEKRISLYISLYLRLEHKALISLKIGENHSLDLAQGFYFGVPQKHPGVGDGQGGLECCDSWGCKESDMTERLY